jgi:hypothetical protein
MRYVHLPTEAQPHVFLFRYRNARTVSFNREFQEVLAWVEQEIPANAWTVANMTFRLSDDVSATAMRLRWC